MLIFIFMPRIKACKVEEWFQSKLGFVLTTRLLYLDSDFIKLKVEIQLFLNKLYFQLRRARHAKIFFAFNLGFLIRTQSAVFKCKLACRIRCMGLERRSLSLCDSSHHKIESCEKKSASGSFKGNVCKLNFSLVQELLLIWTFQRVILIRV